MARTKPVSGKSGLTRGKAALIGILAIVLVAVIYIQYGRSGGDGSLKSMAADHRLAAPRPAVESPAMPPVAEGALDDNMQAAVLAFDQTRWKSPELTTVVAYDPFALPAAFPQPPQAIDPLSSAAPADVSTAAERANQLAEAVEQLRRQLEELKERGVHVIVNEGDQYVAMIGDRTIHVGDEINGFTVTAIDPKGVRVERKDPE